VAQVFTPAQRRQVDRSFRAFSVPPRLRFQGTLPCMAFKPEVPADCLGSDRPEAAGDPTLSIVGAYQPFLYVPSGLLTRLSNDRSTAFLLARVGSAVVSVSLLGMAAWLLLGYDGGQDKVGHRWRLLGLMLAVPPMVVFLASTITGSGPETTGAIAVTAGVLRLSRSQSPPPKAWVVLGVAGFLLGLTRPLAWGWALGISPPIVWARLAGALRATLGQLGQVLRQAIGSFGWLDTPMPTFSHVFWLALVLALAALAMVGGERRQRRVLIGSLAVCVSITLALGVLLAQHDQAVAGRYVLPVVIVLPMLAGEVVANSRGWAATERLRRGVLAATIAVAAVHVLAWLVNARRHAVGTEGPLQFLTNDVWSPLGGWWPWLLAAVAAAFLQAWSAVLLGSGYP
jgi:hypothetical protein